jgi:hypothetical protein
MSEATCGRGRRFAFPHAESPVFAAIGFLRRIWRWLESRLCLQDPEGELPLLTLSWPVALQSGMLAEPPFISASGSVPGTSNVPPQSEHVGLPAGPGHKVKCVRI